MKARCFDHNNKRYIRYGQRGITVCNEWMNFLNFYNWAINNGYNNNLTIDRINVNGNYEPSNCRWVTLKTQMNNMSRNTRLFFNGKNLTYSEWESETGIKQHTIAKRIKSGWSIKDALCTPTIRGGVKHGSSDVRASNR